MTLGIQDAYHFTLLALCIWREARGEPVDTKVAVAWSIRNRVNRPGWWGHDYESVILLPWQYSSFNHNDINATKMPVSNDPSWQDSLIAASAIFAQPALLADPTGGATSYFDMSMDTHPPTWATDGSNVKTSDSGRLRFYKLAA